MSVASNSIFENDKYYNVERQIEKYKNGDKQMMEKKVVAPCAQF